MFGDRYTGEEQEVASSSINWNINLVRALRSATGSRRVIWRRERYGDDYSAAIAADAKTYILRFGSVHNRARKPPIVSFLKIIFDLGDITILEPDQGKGFIKTEYRNEAEEELARLMRELGSEVGKQIKTNELRIQKDAGAIFQRILSAIQ